MHVDCYWKMKRVKTDNSNTRRWKLSHLLLGVAVVYLVFIAFKFPHFLELAAMLSGDDSYVGLDREMDGDVGDSGLSKGFFRSFNKDTFHRRLEDNVNLEAPLMPREETLEKERGPSRPLKPLQFKYGRITGEIMRRRNRTNELSVLERMADEAWTLGLKAWKEVEKFDVKQIVENTVLEGKPESCPSWVSMTGEELANGDSVMFLPCGLAAGSSITVVGTPQYAHQEVLPQLMKRRNGDGLVMVSQFMVELQGLKSVDGEAPPKIFHLNPRLKGDWSHRPVIEHNTCYRMQWGSAHRCDGLPSKTEDDMLGKIHHGSLCYLPWFS